MYVAFLSMFGTDYKLGLSVTSSVTYCEPPETLLIQQLDVVYFASNESVFFNISAASVVGAGLSYCASVRPDVGRTAT